MCNEFLSPPSKSTIWASFLKILDHIACKLVWVFRDGGSIPLGSNRILGINSQILLPPALIHRMTHNGTHFLSQTILQWSFGASVFKSPQQLGLIGDDAETWDQYRMMLSGSGLCYDRGGDFITWDGPLVEDSLIMKDIYTGIISNRYIDQHTTLFSHFWKQQIPTKIILSCWVVWKGKVLTWDNLIKRGHHGPNRCAICCCGEESITHLFFSCPVVLIIWRLFRHPSMDPTWVPTDFISTANLWAKLKGKYRSLPFFFIWEIWLARNRLIFDNMDFHISHIDASIMRWIDERDLHFFGIVDGSHRIRPHEISIPTVFFDGACKDGIMGCGAWVKISGSERIHLHWNGGLGTNNKAEFMSIWGALVMVIKLRLTRPSFYGDSRLVVDCI